MSMKDRIFKSLRHISGIFPLNMMISLTGQKVFLPFYHIISDENISHVKHLYPVPSSEKFISDLEYLLRHFEAVSLDQYIEMKSQKKNKKCFLLSFDDGLKEVNSVIKPVLLQKGIPAHFFINPAFVDNKDLMFRYKTSLLIEQVLHTQNGKLLLEIKTRLNKVSENNDSIPEHLLQLKYHHITIIDEIAELLQIDFSGFLKTHQPYLSLNELKKIEKEGFSIGAHSMNHPEFQYLKIEEQLKQIIQSIDYINKNFNQKYRTFAFPFTDYNVSATLFDIIKTKNLADYTFGGAGLKKEKYDFHFQRVPIEKTTDHIQRTIKNEYIYYLLKAPFGKNTIRRIS